MKVTEVLNEGSASNRFYVVNQEIKVYVNDKYTGTGHHVGGGGRGSSEIQRMTYKEITLNDDDEIHRLVGGIFFISFENGGHKVFEGVLVKPDANRSPFEKSYGTYVNPNDEELKKLVKAGKIDSIPANEAAQKVKYRS